MFSTWVKLASVADDRIAMSQAAADGSAFELGWIGGRWTFRHVTARGDVVAAVTRDMAQAADGTPWTEHWVSLMGGRLHSFWDGWLDDSQLFPATHADDALLNVIYGETVPGPPAGR